MKICDSDHDEICYSAPLCPVCEKMSNLEHMEYALDSAQRDVSLLEESIENLENEIAELRGQ